MPKGPLSKSALVQTLADKHTDKLTRKDVKTLLEALSSVGQTELKKNGIFVLPWLVRMTVVKKPATKERKGINPFTGQPGGGHPERNQGLPPRLPLQDRQPVKHRENAVKMAGSGDVDPAPTWPGRAKPAKTGRK